MGLFGRQDPKPDAAGERGEFPLPPKKAWCGVCSKEQPLTKVWRRNGMMRRCPCCGLEFEKPAELYARVQAVCPKCDEPLEQPGFDYGFCDGCGSKYELSEGAKPGLMPNLAQLRERDKHGKSRSVL